MDADLDLVRRLVAAEHGLAVVATTRADGGVQASVVNAGVVAHPADGEPVVAFVARGGTRKLANLRRRGRLTLVLRHGWEWVAVEGDVDLAGPDDPGLGLTADEQRLLLRHVFAAAGGTHDDLDEYDRVMAAERRTAVLVRCERVYTNPPQARHVAR
ncbi:PPOX class probable F420-dependent enzyme [Geodermatophilus telluris]|uniref:PPOX class probable F420-dependent enzyme n=1 Tax=Geodermatophilus telluris TaxID=1190417 RepID=A0A1G6R201_9ACTN|nr:TIGR03618 family F420-dependent PPOX class oxidoreductase [Geodermatophilus telluris]SDC98578.1 PPOX class probable F420-dependent enzyme [Geodermatophilus telluris]